ncbi:MAG: hypothetical protein AB1730_23215 [Myxococcota bacterium]|jgi:hypothetical protein
MMKRTMMLVAALSMFAAPAFAGNGNDAANGSGLATRDRVRLQTKDGTCGCSQLRQQTRDGTRQQLRVNARQAMNAGQGTRAGRLGN